MTALEELTQWVDQQIAGIRRSMMVEAANGALAAFEQTKRKIAALSEDAPSITGNSDGLPVIQSRPLRPHADPESTLSTHQQENR